jgi:hypothetical protein
MSDPLLAPHVVREDPFVAEVRAVRAAIWDEVGRDLDRLYERVRAVEAAERAAGREFVPAPGAPPRSDAA